MIIITSDRFLAPGPTCSRCDGPKTSSNCRRWPSSSSSSSPSMTSRVVASLTSIIGGRSFFRTALKSHLRGNFFGLFWVVVTRSVFNVGLISRKNSSLAPSGSVAWFFNETLWPRPSLEALNLQSHVFWVLQNGLFSEKSLNICIFNLAAIRMPSQKTPELSKSSSS